MVGTEKACSRTGTCICPVCREKLRRKYLALAEMHEERTKALPEWARKPAPLISEYSPPIWWYRNGRS